MLAIPACTIAPVSYIPPQQLSKANPFADMDCLAGAHLHCAIHSPLQELADKSISLSSRERPVHYAKIIDIGEQALKLRVHLIRAARQSIELQTFIWVNDESGQLILRELIMAARRGVRVRVVVDQPFSDANVNILASLAVTHKNLQVKVFNPILGKAVSSKAQLIAGFATDFALANRRMHNKIIVIDGRIGLTGGRNIANSYFDHDSKYNYLDRDVMIIGPVAIDMQNSFNEYWSDPIAVDLDQHRDVHARIFTDGKQGKIKAIQAGKMPLPVFSSLVKDAIDEHYISRHFINSAFKVRQVQFAADGPRKGFSSTGNHENKASSLLRDLLGNAKKSILIQTPYMLVSPPAEKLIKEARARSPGLDIAVSTNSLASTDAFYVYGLTLKHRKHYIKRLGINIHEMKPVPGGIKDLVPGYPALSPVNHSTTQQEVSWTGNKPLPIGGKGPRFGLHAKSILIDDEISVIGSHNFDTRSLIINTEVILMIHDHEFSQALKKSIRFYTRPENSWVSARRQKIPLLGYMSEYLAEISRMFPVFDLWPFRYSSNYELLEGKSPLPSGHPDFYKHYRNVGQFPDVGLSIKQIETLLISGFGVVMQPLM